MSLDGDGAAAAARCVPAENMTDSITMSLEPRCCLVDALTVPR